VISACGAAFLQRTLWGADDEAAIKLPGAVLIDPAARRAVVTCKGQGQRLPRIVPPHPGHRPVSIAKSLHQHLAQKGHAVKILIG